jgi:hypothetical protein
VSRKAQQQCPATRAQKLFRNDVHASVCAVRKCFSSIASTKSCECTAALRAGRASRQGCSQISETTKAVPFRPHSPNITINIYHDTAMHRRGLSVMPEYIVLFREKQAQSANSPSVSATSTSVAAVVSVAAPEPQRAAGTRGRQP